MGVDPGLTRCGVGVVQGDPGRRIALVEVGVLRTSPALPLALRLVEIEIALDEAVARLRPDAVAVERVFSQHNVRTVIETAQSAAVAMLVAARRGVAVATHTPSEVKAAVTGQGRAGKEQVAVMVQRLLGMSARPYPADATDALALAICHLWRGAAADRLAIAAARAAQRPSTVGDGTPVGGRR